jgi:hypothetical protein
VRRYVEETGLPFDILIDERRDMMRAYGVWHRVGLDAWNIGRPAVFLIDRDGSIPYSFISTTSGSFRRRKNSSRPVLARSSDRLRPLSQPTLGPRSGGPEGPPTSRRAKTGLHHLRLI